MLQITVEKNGEQIKLTRYYALFAFRISDIMIHGLSLADKMQPVKVSDDPFEITDYILEHGNGEKCCVSYYWADDNGRQIEGLNFESGTIHCNYYHL